MFHPLVQDGVHEIGLDALDAGNRQKNPFPFCLETGRGFIDERQAQTNGTRLDLA